MFMVFIATVNVHMVHLMNGDSWPTFTPSQPTWAVSQPIGCYHLHQHWLIDWVKVFTSHSTQYRPFWWCSQANLLFWYGNNKHNKSMHSPIKRNVLQHNNNYYYYIRFNGIFSRTTWLSWHQKGKQFWILLQQETTGWRWHQLDHMQIICTSLQTDNHSSTSQLSFTGRMPFLPPNQQRQSTEGKTTTQTKHKLNPGLLASYDIQPGNGPGLFLFQHFTNLSLTYLLRHIPTYLQPRPTWGIYVNIAIYYYYLALKGGKLSWARHCSMGVQTVLKAVYHSGCHDRHNCSRWDLIL